MDDLFSLAAPKVAPLADRMRPRTLDEFIGQRHIVGPGRLLRRAIEADMLSSSIFFGPPGTGKTTLAHIIAGISGAVFEKLNAVSSGVADVREVLKRAGDRLKYEHRITYLLLDECHRWSKAQSDSILPAIEQGLVRFIGSTTENPMIAMTPALVSRCRVFAFRVLEREDIIEALERALADRERGFGDMHVRVEQNALEHIARAAAGDMRNALNALELAVLTTRPDENNVTVVDLPVAVESIQTPVLQMDEGYFYDMLSAFCKSLRGSDPDAALAWAFRMMRAGVDPRIVVRRMLAHASEDVGLADPGALLQAVAAYQTLECVGMPEAGLAITQAIIYICKAPKSNSVVVAKGLAEADAAEAGNPSVPVHLRDTSYAGAAKLGSGEGYKYPHDYPGHAVEQEYMPQDARGKVFYTPSGMGDDV